MNKYFLYVLCFITLIFSHYSIAAHNLLVNQFCNSNDQLVNFNNNSINPDFTVEFKKHSYDTDIVVKVLDREFGADIVVKDNQDNLENHDNPDYAICKSRNGKTIKISEYLYEPDMKIGISQYDYDITIFNGSSIVSIEEAIVISVLPNYLNFK